MLELSASVVLDGGTSHADSSDRVRVWDLTERAVATQTAGVAAIGCGKRRGDGLRARRAIEKPGAIVERSSRTGAQDR